MSEIERLSNTTGGQALPEPLSTDVARGVTPITATTIATPVPEYADENALEQLSSDVKTGFFY